TAQPPHPARMSLHFHPTDSSEKSTASGCNHRWFDFAVTCIYTQCMEKWNPSELSECYCLAARRRAREITRFYDRRLKEHGLRSTQFSVLAVLAMYDSMPLVKLADALGLERTTLTRSAVLLEKRGWIRSDPSDDARMRPLRLTKSGRQKLEGAFPIWKAAQKEAKKRFGSDSIRQ